MRYVQLRAFHNVAVHGGFSRAAEALHLTQPAISDQVRKLESEYDVRLFDRQKKQVKLTGEGAKLLEITHRMFETEQRALDLLSETQALRTGQLKIVADSVHHMLAVLAAFRKKYPAIFVSVRSGNTETVGDSLFAYDADIGVLGEIPENRDYSMITLSSTPIIAFAPVGSTYAKRKTIRFEELASLPLVIREAGSRTRSKLEQHAEKAGVILNTQIEAEGREAVREIVASGGGVGVVSEAEFGRDSRLAKILISDADLVMDETIVCLRERQESKLIRSFMSLARGIAAKGK